MALGGSIDQPAHWPTYGLLLSVSLLLYRIFQWISTLYICLSVCLTQSSVWPCLSVCIIPSIKCNYKLSLNDCCGTLYIRLYIICVQGVKLQTVTANNDNDSVIASHILNSLHHPFLSFRFHSLPHLLQLFVAIF